MIRILGNGLRVELDRIDHLNGIGAECAQKQLGVVERIKVVDRIGCSKLDSLDLLKIDIKNSLCMRGCAAKPHTVKGFLYGFPQLTIEQRRFCRCLLYTSTN